MANPLTIKIPASLTTALTRDKDEASLPRWALEALVIEAVREGVISRGRGGEVLGLSFGEREQFYADHKVPYDFTPEGLDADLQSLRASLGK